MRVAGNAILAALCTENPICVDDVTEISLAGSMIGHTQLVYL